MSIPIDEAKYMKDVEIDDSSTWHLSQCLKNHSKREGEYSKNLAEAIKQLDEKTLQFEITTAEIAEEIFNKAEEEGNPIPASGKNAIMKTKVILDERYQKLRKEVTELKYIVSVLKGFSKGMNSRGYRLMELCKLQLNQMRGDLSYKEKDEREMTDYGESKYDKFKKPEKRIAEIGDRLEFE